MTDNSPTASRFGVDRQLSKVPEVTVWFWVIKILCTTVGESFADWISLTLGVGLNRTAVIFTVLLLVVLSYQLRLPRYVPGVYWSTVVVLSVSGTLYTDILTDILTDSLAVPLAVSTSCFAVLLGVVFGIWYARERTLSIHSIVTRPRELYYWLAVLVTFALGTAIGDWTLSITGWGPGTSVLLPAGLIAAIAVGRRLGANAVLSFWLAYILTRPLGANLGDWLASPVADHGLGMGTALTSVIFLLAILLVVGYLTCTKRDVINDRPTPAPRPAREPLMLGYYLVVAVATGLLLGWAAAQPHDAGSGTEETGGSAAPALAPGAATARFPADTVASFRAITTDILDRVRSGDQAGARARITDLETAWDDAQPRLQPLDEAGWGAVDQRIDAALTAVRANPPDSTAEIGALTALSSTL
ncbi:hypothetical protein [Skermania piniformis]|uniref:Membrane-anchored protein n=1 Tax=Skermania pinensis TaxID=39122 RepID=A0ABX8S525_9ACTN|nr:hypothetical protein [Skermania piniformis]QXQ12321.1 hypothetical protein KV203_09920 [Skermania piniformis]